MHHRPQAASSRRPARLWVARGARADLAAGGHMGRPGGRSLLAQRNHAQLERPHGRTDGDLRIRRRPSNGFAGSSWSRITEHDPVRLRHNVNTAVTWAVIELL